MTRDMKLAARISVYERHVAELHDELEQMVRDAEQQGARGHAGLYREIEAHLSAARLRLNAAGRLLAEGDPYEYDPEA